VLQKIQERIFKVKTGGNGTPRQGADQGGTETRNLQVAAKWNPPFPISRKTDPPPEQWAFWPIAQWKTGKHTCGLANATELNGTRSRPLPCVAPVVNIGYGK